MTHTESNADIANDVVLQSGIRASELELAPSLELQTTGAPIGVIVEWFGRRFYRGEGPDSIDELPMVGELPVQLLSNRDTKRQGKHVLTGDKVAAATQELRMHSDVQDYQAPPDLTTLHGIDVPPPEAGGLTHFWDLFAGLDAMAATEHLLDDEGCQTTASTDQRRT
jgi:hypothetical protein